MSTEERYDRRGLASPTIEAGEASNSPAVKESVKPPASDSKGGCGEDGEALLMSFTRTTYPNREAWLKGREAGIGASDCASVLNISPWKNAVQLWEEKTGRRKPKDLSDNPAVLRGIAEEPIIRSQFIHDHPEFQVDYHQFDILSLNSNPYILATLDGEITVVRDMPLYGLEQGMRGVLEIKTGSYSTAYYLSQWQGEAMPNHYFAQVVQQLLVTGWDFYWVQAKLFRTDTTYSRGGNNFYLPEQYETFFFGLADSPEVKESKELILQEHPRFWDMWQNDKSPDGVIV